MSMLTNFSLNFTKNLWTGNFSIVLPPRSTDPARSVTWAAARVRSLAICGMPARESLAWISLTEMVEQARQLNPDICFVVGDMTALGLQDQTLAGIVAFYAIVNIPEGFLLSVFREMRRVLQSGGRLLISFHIGDETVRPDELFGQPNSMDFFFFPTEKVRKYLEAAGFAIEDVVERGPYAPEVEHQSRRAYILASKPS